MDFCKRLKFWNAHRFTSECNLFHLIRQFGVFRSRQKDTFSSLENQGPQGAASIGAIGFSEQRIDYLLKNLEFENFHD